MEAAQLIGARKHGTQNPATEGDRRAGFLTPGFAKGAERRSLRYVP
jgi:hypothetical protein